MVNTFFNKGGNAKARVTKDIKLIGGDKMQGANKMKGTYSIPQMRTVSQVMEIIHENDPNSAFTEWQLRELLRTGKLKHVKAGNKYLINLQHLEEYLNNPPGEDEENEEYGTIRKVK